MTPSKERLANMLSMIQARRHQVKVLGGEHPLSPYRYELEFLDKLLAEGKRK
jgi:hypothetical protein